MINRRRLLASSLVLPLTFRSANAASAAPVWRAGPSLPIRIQELYATEHLGQAVVAGGIAARMGVPYFTNQCFSLNPQTRIWQNLPDLPEDRHHVAMVSCGGDLYAVGGFHGTYTSVWQMRSSVFKLTDEGWVPSVALPQPQAEGVVTCQAGAIHLVTGQSPTGQANSARSDHSEVTAHLVWHPGDTQWRTAAPIPTPRNSATGGWIGDMLVVAGGRTSQGNLAATEIYDLREDRWHAAAPLPLPQAGTASVVVGNELLVFGGEIFTPEASVFPNAWRYSLNGDKWTALPDLPTPRHGLGAARINDEVYVIGGATEPGGSGTSDVVEILEYQVASASDAGAGSNPETL